MPNDKHLFTLKPFLCAVNSDLLIPESCFLYLCSNYVVMVAMFFTVSVINNYALNFNIAMPLHMIFRSVSISPMVQNFTFHSCVRFTPSLVFMAGIFNSQHDPRHHHLEETVRVHYLPFIVMLWCYYYVFILNADIPPVNTCPSCWCLWVFSSALSCLLNKWWV